MAQITAALVKKLREKTGAGMMDCKRALSENDGALDASVDWLRTKGLAAAAKKAGRAASEGLIGIAVKGSMGALVEVNAETDFVARNVIFQSVVASIAETALSAGSDINKLKTAIYPGTSRTVEEEITHQVATIGENMILRRVETLGIETGVLASYVHGSLAPGLGKIGVIVGLESTGQKDKLLELGKQLAMHIAATKPMAISKNDLDPEAIERERSVLADQARESGKPEEIIEKMLEGRLRKFFEEVCLVDQTFVIDGETKVSTILKNTSKDIGSEIKLVGFKLLVLGEGLEKKEEDFAAEVAAVAGV